MSFEIKRILNRIKQRTSRNDFAILVIADCCEPLTDEKVAIIKKQKFDFCILIGHITKSNLAKLAPLFLRHSVYYILGSHSNPNVYKEYNFHKLFPVDACFLNFEHGWISVAGTSYPQSDITDDEEIETRKTLFSDIFVCNNDPGLIHTDPQRSGYIALKQHLSFHKPELCIYHQLGGNVIKRFVIDENYEIAAIGIQKCAIIDYHTFKIKNLF